MSILLLTMGPQLSVMRVPTIIAVGNAGAVTFRAIGAVGAVTWTLLHSDLPGEWAGALTPAGNEASITASNVVTAGTYSVTVRAVDNSRQPVIYTTQVVVMALPITISGVLSQWTEGVAVTDTLTISGGTGTYVSLSVIDGALPAGVGVSLSGSTIVFSGTPTAESDGFVKFQVLDDAGTPGQGSFAWDVAENTGDPYWANVISLLHFDGGLADETGRIWSTSGAIGVSTDHKKFGTHSLKIGSTDNSHITSSVPADAFGTGDLTIECWLYAQGGNNNLFAFDGMGVYIDSTSSNIRLYAGSNVITQGGAVINDQLHVALVRESGVMYLFVDGKKSSGWADASNLTTGEIQIGASSVGVGGYYYIDEFRVTKGVARYTSDFSPPTSPFPNY